ncbi:hypothetical protein [Serratia fonticola]|uniref:hypothetical protein n=1 Tax=Serratia fonticola TaxID=47917 RepID=UPI00164719FD|nr:hypothetical protein [Serratia fonticola]MBC3216976.1 hypothetical protein [Serratia fonticola]
MELQFSINEEHINKLKQRINLKRKCQLEKTNKTIEKYALFTLKFITPFLAIFIASYMPFINNHIDLPTKITSWGIFLALYVFLWYRYDDSFTRTFSQYVINNRLTKAISNKLIDITTQLKVKKLSKLKGLHRIKVKNEYLTIIGPTHTETSLHFKEIVRFCENDGFYEIATKHSSRLKLSYLIPTISNAMDESDYKKNINLILEKCTLLKNEKLSN